MSTVKKRVRIDDTVTEISPRLRRPKVVQRSLVSPEVIDEAFQRIFLVSVFVLIQSWKIYDLIMTNGSSAADNGSAVSSLSKVSLIVKYAIVEGLYLWLLPILNVLYLRFSPLVTLLFTLLLNLFNIVLASQLNMALLIAVISPLVLSLNRDKELTVAGDAINPHAIDMNSHFKGKYTIQYLPDSLAKFNVFGMSGVCQDVEDKSTFNIPIEFNTTTDIGLLEIEYTSPENKVSKIAYRDSNLNSLISKDYSHLRGHKSYVSDDYRVFYIEVPVSEPGTYKLSKVKDKKGISMRYVQNPVSFGFCPDVSFVLPRGLKADNQKLCTGSKLDNISTMLPLMTYFGAPPLSVKISASVNGKHLKTIENKVSLEALDANKYNLTHVYAHKITRNSIEQEILKDPSILDVKQSSKIEFQILEITDSLGNYKRFNPKSTSSDVRFGLDILTRPSIRLIEMDSSAKLLVNSTKGLSFAASKNFQEQLPFVAEFEYFSPDGKQTNRFSQTFKTIDDLKRGISISEEGSYKIVNVHGKYCDFQVQHPSEVSISQVAPPSVNVTAKPMIDKCVGMTGYSFDFVAKGEPPFVIEYKVFLNSTDGLILVPPSNGMSKRIIKGNTNNFNFDFKPPGEGNFAIKLESIKDANYYRTPTYLLEEEHTYLTYFKLRSKASFFDGKSSSRHHTVYTCQGQSSNIPVYFKGHFPITFDYAIVNRETNKKVVEKKNQRADTITFDIPTSDIKIGGTYEIILSNIVDSNSCAAEYDSSEKVTLITRSDKPEVSFDLKDTLTRYLIVEGDSIEIPVRVKSSIGRTNNDIIEFQREFDDGKITTGKIVGIKNLRISKPGTYKLTSFSNGRCSGLVSEIKTIVVDYIPRPTISVESPLSIGSIQEGNSNIILKPGCQGCTRKATFKFEGAAPFIIDYEIRLPNGRSELRTMTSEKDAMVVDLPTNKGGQYQHVFKAIYDKNYSKSKSPDTKANHPVITYEVFESPNIVFTGGETVKLCEASLNDNIIDLSAIPIKVQGRPPFEVSLTLTGEDNKKRSFRIQHIQIPQLNLNEALDDSGKPIWKELKQGEYEVHFTKILDSNGCENSNFDEFNAFVFSVTPAPDVMKYDKHKNHYCVGEHVGYDLTGQPPFILTYNFNGKQHKAKLASQFRRLAASPGEITVSSLEDSSAGHCIINIEKENIEKFKDLTIKIHDLPSVEINQGDSIIQDIHEGDMTEMKFTFTGTPPFTVKYTRTLEPNSKAKRSKSSKRQNGMIVETETIENIMDHEYTVKVGLEGTYEAIEIRDKYCKAAKE